MLLLVDMGRHASDNEATTRGAASRSATPPPVAHAASGGCVMVSAEPELERLIHSFTPALYPTALVCIRRHAEVPRDAFFFARLRFSFCERVGLFFVFFLSWNPGTFR